MGPRTIGALLKETVFEWYADRGPRLGAALAFYTLFSLAPLLIIVMAIAALAFGQEVAHTQTIQQIEGLIGMEGAQAVQSVIENASKPSSGVTATLIGLATLLFGATIVFSELQDALNIIWKIPSRPERSLVIGLIRDRFLSFIMVLAIGFLLLLALLTNTALAAIAQIFREALPSQTYFLRVANSLFFLVILTMLFAMIYKFLPDTDIGWEGVLIGAVATALLFAIGKFLIGLYLVYSSITSVYGAAGSLVVVLVWVYYSAQIFYFGAEFTKVYATRRRHKVVSTADSKPITQRSGIQ
ncbi:MAG TPA: YihY/virulence factor BrkB family protein [Candidatus Tectomicrobia bacterium]|nr:YihY/virulence factor BrkB family protein [Candidatus Tectomicrobia bacterium]